MNTRSRVARFARPTFMRIVLIVALLFPLLLTLPAQAAGDDILAPDFGSGFGTSDDGTVRLADNTEYNAVVQLLDGSYVVAGGRINDFWLARYTAAGILDTGFGIGGEVGTDLGFTDAAHVVALQADGKIVAAGGSGFDFGLARYLPNGALDTTFGNGGTVRTDFNNPFPSGEWGSSDRITALAVQPDGKIIAGGYSSACHNTVCNNGFALARYNPDGSLDRSFFNNGRLIDFFIADDGTTGGQINALTLLPDGKILAVGHGKEYNQLGIARYHPDGQLDRSFDGDGKRSYPGLGAAHDFTLRPDGKLLIVTSDKKLVRLNPDGTRDTSFGADGVVTLITPDGVITPYQIVPRADGTVMIAGTRINAAGVADLVLARYTATGLPDSGFADGDGYQVIHFGDRDSSNDFADMILDGSERILLLGRERKTGSRYLARLLPDGTPDRRAGRTTTNIYPGDDVIYDLVVQPDGSTIAAGTATGSRPEQSVVRYTPDGTLDPTFGSGGRAAVFNSRGRAVAIDPTGRILVAGYTDDGSRNPAHDFRIQRYHPDGRFDNTFVVTTDLGQPYDVATAMVALPDNRVVVAGSSGATRTSTDFALVRYNATGTRDSSFGENGVVITRRDGIEGITALARQDDGKYVVVGRGLNTAGTTGSSIIVARYTVSGALDTGFGNGQGYVITQIETGHRPEDLLVQPDGKIVVGGSVRTGGATQLLAVRYNTDGTLDSSFGNAGIALAQFDEGKAAGYALVREPDGSLLVAGCVEEQAFAVARFSAAGTLDGEFGDKGRATIDFGGPSACAYAAAYDAESASVVIGGAAELNAGDQQFALIKLRGGDVTPNTPPIGQFDFYRIDQDTTFDSPAPGVLANDIDQDGDPLSATLITTPNYGTLSLNADGSFHYVPPPGFSGQDLFTYRAGDGRDASDTTTVLISVVPAAGNRVPQAQRNGYDTLQDTQLYVPWPGVLDNDSDADNDTLVAELVTAPAHGMLELRSDGAYTYIPDEGFVGEDHFRYRINDGVDFSEPADITLRVQAAETNVPPIAVGDRFATPSDTRLEIGAPGVLGNDLDMNGDDLTAALVEQAARGTVTLNSDGTFVYTPDAGFTGIDQFTYAVSDGTHTKQTTVVIAVGTISDEPGDNPGDEPNPAPDDGQPAIYLPLIIR